MNRSLCFGAVLWDIIGEKRHVGGAPFNVAASLAGFGWESYMLTCVGADKLGGLAEQEFDRLQIRKDYLQVDGKHPTGTSVVTLSDAGIPSYILDPTSAYNYVTLSRAQLTKLQNTEFDILYFGTFEQRGDTSRNTLDILLETGRFKHVFFDVNIRDNFCPPGVLRKSLTYTTILKINDEEESCLCNILYGCNLSSEEFCKRIADMYQIQVVCITRGPLGCDIYHNGVLKRLEGQNVRVVDTVGAGDGFSAAFLSKYMEGNDPYQAARYGNMAGGYIAGCAGAIPSNYEELRALLRLNKGRDEL